MPVCDIENIFLDSMLHIRETCKTFIPLEFFKEKKFHISKDEHYSKAVFWS